MRVEYIGQVRWEGEPWQPSGRFDHEPTRDELRAKAWNVIAMKSKGSPKPNQVRAVKVTYEAMPSVSFSESAR